MNELKTRCCIVGGGPAGMMLGFLLARAGVDVVVLEKHGDFLRDFRGDTIHPSTLELLHELELLPAFLKLPHQELSAIRLTVGQESVPAVDFSGLPVHCPFLAFMPQWDFLNFLVSQAGHLPTFTLRMATTVTNLLRADDGHVVGVEASTPDGLLRIKADLVVGADGRHSVVRERAGLSVQTFGVPIDVLWLRIPKDAAVHEQSLAYLNAGKFMVLIDRHDYFQCGYIIPKGQFNQIRQRGLAALQADIVSLAPFVKNQIGHLNSWDDVYLLTVKIDRLTDWCQPGLLCIGDAAHAMSPAGGVGVNLAIQDAVATANLLAVKLRNNTLTINDLRRVQRRRQWPVRVIQSFQVFVHRQITNPATAARQRPLPALPLWLLRHSPLLRRLMGRFIGLGPRPEHVRTPVAS